jgi:DnaK suppressor protein
MPASKKKAPAKTSAPSQKSATKKAAKPSASTVKSAAARLKSLFSSKASKPKPAAKAAKASPKAKAVAAKKPAKPVKKPAVKKSAVKPVKTAKPRPAAKKAAAKPVARKPAPAKKAAVVKPAPAKPKPAVKKKPTPPAKPAKGASLRYKGELTEDLIRRMPERDYMNDAQLDFFRQRLMQMREEVLAREVDVKERLHQREIFADPADRATAEEEHWLDLRLRERESLLLRKIDEALRRIAEKEFGYCEKTGDPIGIPRLLARPTATVCVDIKGQDERVEAQFRDR